MDPFGKEVVVKVTGSTTVIVAVAVTAELALETASRLTVNAVVRPVGAT